MDHEALAGLSVIDESEILTAPYGAIVVDRTGEIQLYNRYESELAHLSEKNVVGKNFFHTIAPCTGVAAFEGRFLEFLEFDDTVSESFAYFFPFAHGDVNVLVTFVKREIGDAVVIVIQRVDEEVAAPLKDFYSPIFVG